MRCVIIDDELDARLLLHRYCTNFFPNIEIVGEAESVAMGIKLIQETNPNIVLLDILMQDGNGFELVEHFANPKFQIIFTTAYDDFALKAFKYNAIDYLLKPIDPIEFQNAINKTMQLQKSDDFIFQMTNLLHTVKTKSTDRITLQTGDGLTIVKISTIVRIESDGNYATLYLNNKEKVVVLKSLRDFEELLPANAFCRTHQSHIANLDYVKKVSRGDGDFLIFENNDKIPISRRKKEEVIALIEDL